MRIRANLASFIGATAVLEPTVLALLGLGLAGMTVNRKKNRFNLRFVNN